MYRKEKFHFETMQLHAGQRKMDPETGSRAVPVHLTSAYVFESAAHASSIFDLSSSGNIYGRLTNPTQEAFERKMTVLEGGAAALAVASGAAAVAYSLDNVLSPGDHIVVADNLYGGTFNFITHTLAARGVKHTITDINDPVSLREAIRPETKVVYGETFGNPNSEVTDIRLVADIAHSHGALCMIDNTFGTPYLIRPIEHGADIVIHSATKFICGHGTALGGIIVDSGKFDFKSHGKKFPSIAAPDPNYHGAVFADVFPESPFAARVRAVVLRDGGACISPLNAFLMLQGLETLSLRVERHVCNALAVVKFLACHPKVRSVSHPSLPSHPCHELYKRYFPQGGGSIFTFDIEGGCREAWEFIDRLKLFSLVANVADVRSLVIHPATTTHSQMSAGELAGAKISGSTIRLSIGLEHIDDIIADISQALGS